MIVLLQELSKRQARWTEAKKTATRSECRMRVKNGRGCKRETEATRNGNYPGAVSFAGQGDRAEQEAEQDGGGGRTGAARRAGGGTVLLRHRARAWLPASPARWTLVAHPTTCTYIATWQPGNGPEHEAGGREWMVTGRAGPAMGWWQARWEGWWFVALPVSPVIPASEAAHPCPSPLCLPCLPMVELSGQQPFTAKFASTLDEVLAQ